MMVSDVKLANGKGSWRETHQYLLSIECSCESNSMDIAWTITDFTSKSHLHKVMNSNIKEIVPLC